MSAKMGRKKTWQDWLAAWNSHDWDRLSHFFTDDCIFEDIAVGRVCHGKQELKAYFDHMLVWSADFKIESKSFFTIGNWMAGEGVMSGTHTGDVPRMKATGKNIQYGELRSANYARAKLAERRTIGIWLRSCSESVCCLQLPRNSLAG